MNRREYDAIHGYIRYKFGKADRCENPSCLNQSSRFEWALIKGKRYARVRENFFMLCKLCHIEYDGQKPEKLHTLRNHETLDRIQNAKYKPVIQCSRSGIVIQEWQSATHAEIGLRISRKAIYNNIYGLSKSAGGFIWKVNG